MLAQTRYFLLIPLFLFIAHSSKPILACEGALQPDNYSETTSYKDHGPISFISQAPDSSDTLSQLSQSSYCPSTTNKSVFRGATLQDNPFYLPQDIEKSLFDLGLQKLLQHLKNAPHENYKPAPNQEDDDFDILSVHSTASEYVQNDSSHS